MFGSSKTYLVQKNVIEKLGERVSGGRHQVMLESACYLLSYIADVVCAVKHTGGDPAAAANVLSPPYDGEAAAADVDVDWAEDIAPEEEDSTAEDSVSAASRTKHTWTGNVLDSCFWASRLLVQQNLLLTRRMKNP